MPECEPLKQRVGHNLTEYIERGSVRVRIAHLLLDVHLQHGRHVVNSPFPRRNAVQSVLLPDSMKIGLSSFFLIVDSLGTGTRWYRGHSSPGWQVSYEGSKYLHSWQAWGREIHWSLAEGPGCNLGMAVDTRLDIRYINKPQCVSILRTTGTDRQTKRIGCEGPELHQYELGVVRILNHYWCCWMVAANAWYCATAILGPRS